MRLEELEHHDQFEELEQLLALMVLLLFFIRAGSFGATLKGDISLLPIGDLNLILRRVKRGNQLAEPTQKTIPPPPADNLVASRVFTIFKKVLGRNPGFSGESLGLNFENAAGMITKWIRQGIPSESIGLPAGSYISSHSGRITGASHARYSARADIGAIMDWGGWKTASRCMLYTREVPRSEFWREFYFFLGRNFAVVDRIGWGARGHDQ